jgi:hypothetical protein
MSWFAHFRARPFAVRLAVGLWVTLILAVSVRVAVVKPTSGSVVPIYRHAALAWVAGEDLYDPVLDPGPPPTWLDHYRNPPTVAAAFVPFALLPVKAAAVAWRLLGAAVFLTGLAAWVRDAVRVRGRELTPGETGVVFALALPLALASLNNGQTNLVIIGSLLHGAAAAARGRFVVAAAFLAGGGLVKLYPLAAGLLLAAAYPRRLAPWLAAGVAAWFALPFAFQNPEYVANTYRQFWGYLGSDDRTFAPLDRAPKDLFIFLRVWFGPPPVAAYKGFVLATAVAMAGLVVFAARRRPLLVPELALHLGCVWMTALGPASEGPTYTLMAPTVAVVLVGAWAVRAGGGGKLRLLVAAAGYGLLVSPVLRDMFPGGLMYQALGPQPVGAMLVLAVVAWDAVRALARTEPEPVVLAFRAREPHSADRLSQAAPEPAAAR